MASRRHAVKAHCQRFGQISLQSRSDIGDHRFGRQLAHRRYQQDEAAQGEAEDLAGNQPRPQFRPIRRRRARRAGSTCSANSIRIRSAASGWVTPARSRIRSDWSSGSPSQRGQEMPDQRRAEPPCGKAASDGSRRSNTVAAANSPSLLPK